MICTKCNKEKYIEEFSFRNKSKGILHRVCKECHKVVAQKHYIRNKNKYKNRARTWSQNNKKDRASILRNSDLRRKYNMTIDDYMLMDTQQKGKCAICNTKCRSKRILCVDHCHETGKVRGLLCLGCNTALGNFKDDIVLLEKAIIYLEKHR